MTFKANLSLPFKTYTFLILAAAFCLPFFCCSAQTNINIEQYNDEKVLYNQVYADVLDAVEFQRCVTYEKDTKNCLYTEPTIKYLYDTKVYATEDVINKNTVRVDADTIKIYSGDTFKETNGQWTKIETGYIEKMEYETTNEVMQVDTGKILFHNNPFKIYALNAQTYSNISDVHVQCSSDLPACRANTGGSMSVGTASEDTLACGLYAGVVLYRPLFPFDIDLGGQTIASGTFNVYQTIHDTANGKMKIYEATPANPASIVGNDWATVSSDTISDEEIDNTDNAWASFDLNSNGISYFTDGDTITVGMKDYSDYGTAGSNYYLLRTSDYTGTDYDPYLELTLEEEEATTTESSIATPGALPIWNDIGVISGYIEHWGNSTTAPTEVEYVVYHIPFFVWLVFWLIFSFVLGRLIIEVLIILRRK